MPKVRVTIGIQNIGEEGGDVSRSTGSTLSPYEVEICVEEGVKDERCDGHCAAHVAQNLVYISIVPKSHPAAGHTTESERSRTPTLNPKTTHKGFDSEEQHLTLLTLKTTRRPSESMRSSHTPLNSTAACCKGNTPAHSDVCTTSVSPSRTRGVSIMTTVHANTPHQKNMHTKTNNAQARPDWARRLYNFLDFVSTAGFSKVR
jgi:hypothetical protein